MSELNTLDYYKMFGVSKNATQVQIKTAYKRLAIKYHPDKNLDDKNAETNFKKIEAAFYVIGDIKRRGEYDVNGVHGKNIPHFNSKPNNNPSVNKPSNSFNQSNNSFNQAQKEYNERCNQAEKEHDERAKANKMWHDFFNDKPNSNTDSFFNSNFNFNGSANNVNSSEGSNPFSRFNKSNKKKSNDEYKSYKSDEKKSLVGILETYTYVIIKNLISTRGLNFRRGQIISYDHLKERYDVSVDGDLYKLKRENMHQLILGVEIYGMIHIPELNGQVGNITDYNFETGRYSVRLPHCMLGFDPLNVILPVGSCLVIIGLTNPTSLELNGKQCTLVSIDRNKQNYTVCLQSQEKNRIGHIALKWDKVRI
jgi:curved DNA-binding protein CbpA